MKNYLQMVMVLLKGRTIDQSIAKENQEFSEIWFLKVSHSGLESGWCISESRRHYKEFIMLRISPKSCFMVICWLDSNLMVP